tara:strand:+ start:295 stop:531 length:237 start_codon:yes stop_codon:yes gene_type:complete
MNLQIKDDYILWKKIANNFLSNLDKESIFAIYHIIKQDNGEMYGQSYKLDSDYLQSAKLTDDIDELLQNLEGQKNEQR